MIQQSEKFVVIPQPISNCRNCDNLTYIDCINCKNCGFCIDQRGFGKCVSGNINGPNDKLDCMQWNFGDNTIKYPKGYSTIYPHAVNSWSWSGNKL